MIRLKGGDIMVVKLTAICGTCSPLAVKVPVDSGSLLTKMPKRLKVSVNRNAASYAGSGRAADMLFLSSSTAYVPRKYIVLLPTGKKAYALSPEPAQPFVSSLLKFR